MKNQKGITLIALVITIIVLLILAGVSISMVIGNNGILNQASTAGQNTTYASEEEQVEIAYLSAKTKKLGGSVTVAELQQALDDNQVEANAELDDDNTTIIVTFTKTGNEYSVVGEIVTRVGQAEVLPEEPADPNNGMYSVPEKVTPAPQKLFNIEILDESAKTAKITGMNNSYIIKNEETFYHINDSTVTDTLVVPYEVIPEGKDEPYTVTEVNLYVRKAEYDGTEFPENVGAEPGSRAGKVWSPFPEVKRIIYPNTVTVLDIYGEYANLPTGESAFRPYEQALEEVILPSNITEIPKQAFWSCTNLRNITIPSNVNKIGQQAFYMCDNLSEVRCEMTTPPVFGSYCFYTGIKSTFYFKNSTVAEAFRNSEGYTASLMIISDNYSW